MTDEEIIASLKCCVEGGECDKCPLRKKCNFFYDREYIGMPDILVLSLELIKKQKAKLDKLENGKKL